MPTHLNSTKNTDSIAVIMYLSVSSIFLYFYYGKLKGEEFSNQKDTNPTLIILEKYLF